MYQYLIVLMIGRSSGVIHFEVRVPPFIHCLINTTWASIWAKKYFQIKKIHNALERRMGRDDGVKLFIQERDELFRKSRASRKVQGLAD